MTVNEPFETTFGLLVRGLRGVLLQGIAEDFNDFFRPDPLFLGYPLFFGVVSYVNSIVVILYIMVPLACVDC